MAAALSRALKLPGKKGSELGEYDPLTQADSEEESEEDDLVLNYPRNGLGRGNCMGAGAGPAELLGSRAGRLVEEEEDEVDEDEDEWRDRYPSKARQDRDELKTRQYWSQRESSRDAGIEDRGCARSGGDSGLRLDPASDPEAKRVRMRGAVRTAFFLVPLCCAVLLVLLCAFLLPCQQGELDKRPQWETGMGEIGSNLPPLGLWDVDNDTVEDVLVSVIQPTNDSLLPGSQGNNKEYSVAALSAVSGKVLWKTALKEATVCIQCGLRPQARPAIPAHRAFLQRHSAPTALGRGSGPVCLLIGSAHITAVDGSTGKTLWTVAPGEIVSKAVSVPDLTRDSIPDLLIATLPADQVSDLTLLLLSGVSGAPIGHPVTFNLTAQGKLIGPELHVTRQGAYYILFGLGTVEAAWLMDIYTQATASAASRAKVSPTVKLKDPIWEAMRKPNSSVIHISSTEQVDFFLPLVAGLCNNHNNLDPLSSLNSSNSDWVLVSGASKLSVLKERDAHVVWTVSSAAIRSRPTPGHFNGDGIPDILIQQLVSPSVKKIQIIDGGNGRVLWEAEFVCPHSVLEGSSLLTTSGLSVFLFWAGDPQSAKNLTKTTVSRLGSPADSLTDPVLQRLYLLHPTYPTILLELTSTTDTILTSAISYQEQQKDASYFTISSRRSQEGLRQGSQVIRSMSLRASIAESQIWRLSDAGKAGTPIRPGDFELNKFFRQLAFRHYEVKEKKVLKR
ncbi:protein FAM234B isoform X2 [Scleropages formosus]|uniref:protein FAM234B isoform X2 n=1 Tax=Scleropages formosus TaxID=113540 RepID=UPI0008783EC0|nr:protein FAM234B isoform X2 [Scleropages formosus]